MNNQSHSNGLIDKAQTARPHRVVWVISDGIVGHYNQSKGVMLALHQLYNIEEHWVELKLRSGGTRSILRLLLNAFNARLPLGLLSLFYSGALPVQVPDLLVGAGGKSSFAVAWLAKQFRAQSIFTGSLRGLNPEFFSAVLVIDPESASQYITLETAPMPVTRAMLISAAAGWKKLHETIDPPMTASEPVYWTLLIGGDGAGASYSEADWHNLALQINTIAAQQGIRWLITTSRRTGAAAEQILQANINPSFIADAVWWSMAGRPVMQEFLGLAEVVVCTVDSLSMLTEAVVAQKQVIAIQPALFKPNPRYQMALDRLVNAQRVLPLTIVELSSQLPLLAQLQPFEEEQVSLLADRLKSHLDMS